MNNPSLEPVYIKNLKVGVSYLIFLQVLFNDRDENTYNAQNLQMARFPRGLFTSICRLKDESVWGGMKLKILFYARKIFVTGVCPSNLNTSKLNFNLYFISSFHKPSSVCCSLFLLGNCALHRKSMNHTPTLRQLMNTWTRPILVNPSDTNSHFNVLNTSASANKCTVYTKEFAHLNMNHHHWRPIMFFKWKMNLTLSSHFYIIAVPWILYGHVFKKDITLITLVNLHTSITYLHSLQWFSIVMSDGFSVEWRQKRSP